MADGGSETSGVAATGAGRALAMPADPGDKASLARSSVSSLTTALVFIALILLARIIYTGFFCPYDLVEDEAHYWLWSRHPDWSYYSKGPGIAWAIRASTMLFGHQEWAVRLPTVIASAAGALACAGLARDVARRAFVDDGSVARPSWAAVFAAAAYLLAPAFQVTGILVTIDGCYLACWAWACWMGWRALMERSRPAWLLLGAAIGVGFVFKYTILLLVPGLALYWALRSRRLRMCPGWGAWMTGALVVVLLGLAPVVYWNYREDWPTVRHLVGHLGLEGGDVPIAPSPAKRGYDPAWTLEYLSAPIGMFGPVLALGVVAALRVFRRKQATTPIGGDARRLGAAFLLCCAAPILLFYLVVSFIAEPEQNWAIAGFVSVVTLAGWYAADELARRAAGADRPHLTAPPAPRTRVVKVLWRLSIIYGVCAALILHRADLAAALANRASSLPPIASAIRAVRGRDAGPVVPGRLIGAKQMALHARRVIESLDSQQTGRTGSKPVVLIAEHYGRASQLDYYLNRPMPGATAGTGRGVAVFSAQSVMGGRRSQFDLWPDRSLTQPGLIGADALLLSNDKPQTVARWERMFERVEPLNSTRTDDPRKLEGEHKKDRVAFIGRGFRGIEALTHAPEGERGNNQESK
ncbi:MAG: glycosyltransferase family 39 protein [Phycisphaerales bacterium]|nr:glycosyltransferase family 39 protein [Phycisphaerales bacterium]